MVDSGTVIFVEVKFGISSSVMYVCVYMLWLRCGEECIKKKVLESRNLFIYRRGGGDPAGAGTRAIAYTTLLEYTDTLNEGITCTHIPCERVFAHDSLRQ
jgi:hypothetical protein